MIIEPISEEDLLNPELMDKVLTETAKSSIPFQTKKMLESKEARQEMLEKYGSEAFLLPDELKFPVVNPKTGQPDCKLIYAARIRALQFKDRKPGYNEVAKKAEELYQSNGCQKRINIQIKEHESVYDLVELLNLLELDFAEEESMDKGI